MEELILTIVKPLVDYPEDVKILVNEDEGRITYQLSVHKEDMGKVIGKQGRVAKSIRTVVYAAAGSTQQKKVFLEIID
ncbi:KH domain-containing protein [Falsibacillus pallidus]|uniref:RNA-binding protein KhpA n=1 Tax=Falsibacillus pallidus TaxID=493781 RepID=A0A370GXZ0_9BACI|nr:KH domain-containing protein [Falsibacillus pallidus]RDI47484.1 RNA-binding protein with KH domain [Falsibacillus pallidus]